MGRGKEERERERGEGGNVKSFAREAIYRFVKFIAQLHFFFFFTRQVHFVEIILETLR